MSNSELERIETGKLYHELMAINRDLLRQMRAFIDDILAEQLPLIDLTDVDQVAEQGEESKGYYELKTIKGYGPYIYRRYKENGRLRSEYIGKAKTAS